jgi:2-keto-4-pentenoate hydratase/2-oxohepta-3-ene-1,7-dioic acid hydratase in catechol pathway
MQFVRFRVNNEVHYGILEDERIRVMAGTPFEADPTGRLTGQTFSLSEVRLLAPVMPGKILAAAVNYPSHAINSPVPTKPELFLKPPSSVIGPEEPVIIPADAGRVDAEGELVAVIGRRARNVRPEEALNYVLGYTCGFDISARVWQRGDRQWWRAKGSDTFSPIGPVIATGLDPASLTLVTRVNGVVRQESPTSELVYDVPALIATISRHMTLEPGDLIFTGTPGETPEIRPGDVIEVEITGIGVLRNPVRGED